MARCESVDFTVQSPSIARTILARHKQDPDVDMIQVILAGRDNTPDMGPFKFESETRTGNKIVKRYKRSGN